MTQSFIPFRQPSDRYVKAQVTKIQLDSCVVVSSTIPHSSKCWQRKNNSLIDSFFFLYSSFQFVFCHILFFFFFPFRGVVSTSRFSASFEDVLHAHKLTELAGEQVKMEVSVHLSYEPSLSFPPFDMYACHLNYLISMDTQNGLHACTQPFLLIESPFLLYQSISSLFPYRFFSLASWGPAFVTGSSAWQQLRVIRGHEETYW